MTAVSQQVAAAIASSSSRPHSPSASSVASSQLDAIYRGNLPPNSEDPEAAELSSCFGDTMERNSNGEEERRYLEQLTDIGRQIHELRPARIDIGYGGSDVGESEDGGAGGRASSSEAAVVVASSGAPSRFSRMRKIKVIDSRSRTAVSSGESTPRRRRSRHRSERSRAASSSPSRSRSSSAAPLNRHGLSTSQAEAEAFLPVALLRHPSSELASLERLRGPPRDPLRPHRRSHRSGGSRNSVELEPEPKPKPEPEPEPRPVPISYSELKERIIEVSTSTSLHVQLEKSPKPLQQVTQSFQSASAMHGLQAKAELDWDESAEEEEGQPAANRRKLAYPPPPGRKQPAHSAGEQEPPALTQWGFETSADWIGGIAAEPSSAHASAQLSAATRVQLRAALRAGDNELWTHARRNRPTEEAELQKPNSKVAEQLRQLLSHSNSPPTVAESDRSQIQSQHQPHHKDEQPYKYQPHRQRSSRPRKRRPLPPPPAVEASIVMATAKARLVSVSADEADDDDDAVFDAVEGVRGETRWQQQMGHSVHQPKRMQQYQEANQQKHQYRYTQQIHPHKQREPQRHDHLQLQFDQYRNYHHHQHHQHHQQQQQQQQPWQQQPKPRESATANSQSSSLPSSIRTNDLYPQGSEVLNDAYRYRPSDGSYHSAHIHPENNHLPPNWQSQPQPPPPPPPPPVPPRRHQKSAAVAASADHVYKQIQIVPAPAVVTVQKAEPMQPLTPPPPPPPPPPAPQPPADQRTPRKHYSHHPYQQQQIETKSNQQNQHQLWSSGKHRPVSRGIVGQQRTAPETAELSLSRQRSNSLSSIQNSQPAQQQWTPGAQAAATAAMVTSGGSPVASRHQIRRTNENKTSAAGSTTRARTQIQTRSFRVPGKSDGMDPAQPSATARLSIGVLQPRSQQAYQDQNRQPVSLNKDLQNHRYQPETSELLHHQQPISHVQQPPSQLEGLNLHQNQHPHQHPYQTSATQINIQSSLQCEKQIYKPQTYQYSEQGQTQPQGQGTQSQPKQQQHDLMKQLEERLSWHNRRRNGRLGSSNSDDSEYDLVDRRNRAALKLPSNAVKVFPAGAAAAAAAAANLRRQKRQSLLSPGGSGSEKASVSAVGDPVSEIEGLYRRMQLEDDDLMDGAERHDTLARVHNRLAKLSSGGGDDDDVFTGTSKSASQRQQQHQQPSPTRPQAAYFVQHRGAFADKMRDDQARRQRIDSQRRYGGKDTASSQPSHHQQQQQQHQHQSQQQQKIPPPATSSQPLYQNHQHQYYRQPNQQVQMHFSDGGNSKATDSRVVPSPARPSRTYLEPGESESGPVVIL